MTRKYFVPSIIENKQRLVAPSLAARTHAENVIVLVKAALLV
jgi:hypothetical protein